MLIFYYSLGIRGWVSAAAGSGSQPHGSQAFLCLFHSALPVGGQDLDEASACSGNLGAGHAEKNYGIGRVAVQVPALPCFQTVVRAWDILSSRISESYRGAEVRHRAGAGSAERGSDECSSLGLRASGPHRSGGHWALN